MGIIRKHLIAFVISLIFWWIVTTSLGSYAGGVGGLIGLFILACIFTAIWAAILAVIKGVIRGGKKAIDLVVGQGTLTYANGDQEEGIWEKDEFLYENKGK